MATYSTYCCFKHPAEFADKQRNSETSCGQCATGWEQDRRPPATGGVEPRSGSLLFSGMGEA